MAAWTVALIAGLAAAAGWGAYAIEHHFYKRAMAGWVRALDLWKAGTQQWTDIYDNLVSATELRDRAAHMQDQDVTRQVIEKAERDAIAFREGWGAGEKEN